MKIRCLLALAAVASMARGMTEDNDEPQQRRLNQLGASFGDAADLLSTYRPGGGASLTVGRSQEDENAVPGVFRQLGEGFGNAAASLRNGGLGGLVALATSSQQNEASEEPEAKKLCVRPGTDAACEAEEEAEEEEAFRQKARIDEPGCDGFVVQFPTQKNGQNLWVELDENQGENCPARDLVKTKNSRVTFLDAEGKEMAWDDVRRPFEPKLIKGGQKARTKLEDQLKDYAAPHLANGEKTPLPNFKAREIDWDKVDATNVLDIPVKEAPVMDISEAVFRASGKGKTWERMQVRNYLMDLRALRQQYHKETLKKTHHLLKGFDELYDPATNSFRYEQVEWYAGSGRCSIWKAVSKKIKEVDALLCPHTNTLASADVHRDECPTNFFHDEEFANIRDRSTEGLTGEETELPPGSLKPVSGEEGFEGIYGYVPQSSQRIFWFWRFYVRNQGGVASPGFYNTKFEARDAREEAMDDFDFPPFLSDGYTSDPRFRTRPSWRLDPDFWKAIYEDGVPNPWDFGFGQDYAEYENSGHRYHGTSLQNLLANLEDIKKNGLLLRALCDDPESNIPHSKCGKKLWACATMRNCFAHMRSDMTISRHVKNELNTYDKWFEIAILALPVAGWKKKHTPDYLYSGFYSEGPVVPVACLRVNLLEGKLGLEKARKWAADGHPRDHPDSCF